MTLDEFLREQRTSLRRFEAEWRANHASNPSAFPITMEGGDWFDQLLTLETGESDSLLVPEHGATAADWELQLQALLQGTAVEVNGYKLNPDVDEGLVWVTNPYGIDCALFEATGPGLQKFLCDLPAIGTLGPAPHPSELDKA